MVTVVVELTTAAVTVLHTAAVVKVTVVAAMTEDSGVIVPQADESCVDTVLVNVSEDNVTVEHRLGTTV